MANQTELAWAAGFFDGEGHIGMPKRKVRKGGWSYAAAVVVISQCEPTTLERFRGAVELGKVGGPLPAPKNGISKRDRWQYSAHGQHALAVGKLIYPYLSKPKRAQYQGVVEAAEAIRLEREQGLQARQAPRDVDLLRQMYWDGGLSGEECAAALGMSASSLRRWMSRTNFPRRNPAQGRWATARRAVGPDLGRLDEPSA